MAKNTIYTGNIKLINNSLDKIDSKRKSFGAPKESMDGVEHSSW